MKQPTGTVICTGVSKTGRLPFLKEAAAAGRAAGAQVEIYDVGSRLLHKAKILGIPYRDEKILDAPEVTLKTLRAAVFEEILKNLSPEKLNIISLHACFKWNRTLMAGFDPYYLNLLKPTLFLTVVEDLKNIERRMEESAQWKGRMSRREIVDWQNEETFVTQTMASFLNRPFYMLPKAQSFESVWKLMANPDHPKAYLSYPISALFNEDSSTSPEEFFRDVADFKKFAEELFVIFDPMSIKDLDGDPTGSAEPEVELLKKVTVWRDFTFINQVDCLLVYNPLGTDSPGVNDEVFHGFSNNRDVYLYYKPTKRSPFLESKTTRIFSDMAEMKVFLQERYGSGPIPGAPLE